MKVLFITRTFPPSIGGMQRFAYDLSRALPEAGVKLTMVTWGGSSRLALPFVLPWLFLNGLWKLMTDRSIEVIHMQDTVLSPLGWLLSKLSNKPWMVVAHGLDLTFALPMYQKVNIFFARKTGHMIANSHATANEARRRGIPPAKLSVIPLGVTETPAPKSDRGAVLASIGVPKEAQIVLTVGRLTKRKGVTWFITQVLPQLAKDPTLHYVIIGDGAQRTTIKQAIAKQGLDTQVHLLGAVDDQTKLRWLAAADIFVMPNITVPGDMEGFGIVAHEAALAELPVVASGIEGIAEAVQDNKNGILLPEGDKMAYVETLQQLLSHPKQRQALGKQARRYTLATFGWPKIAERYCAAYEDLISSETEAS